MFHLHNHITLRHSNSQIPWKHGWMGAISSAKPQRRIAVDQQLNVGQSAPFCGNCRPVSKVLATTWTFPAMSKSVDNVTLWHFVMGCTRVLYFPRTTYQLKLLFIFPGCSKCTTPAKYALKQKQEHLIWCVLNTRNSQDRVFLCTFHSNLLLLCRSSLIQTSQLISTVKLNLCGELLFHFCLSALFRCDYKAIEL